MNRGMQQNTVKKLGAVTVAAFLVIVIMTGATFTGMTVHSAAVLVVCEALGLALSGAVIYYAYERCKEIDSGEEKDATDNY